MRNSSSKSKSAVLLAAAAGLAVSAQLASAQVWIDPTGGNWNDAGNWSGGIPVSAFTTQLTFNASGETYTATNDLANPFNLNAITFNNTGGGQININGNPLLFGGTSPAINQNGSGAASMTNAIAIASSGANTDVLTFGGTGAGNLTLSGALSSSPAAGGTGGGSIRQTNANGNLILSGGGDLYSIRASAGSITLNGGAWNVRSTQRFNDYITGINDGFWGLNIGDAPGGTTRFTMIGGTLDGPGMFLGTNGGATNAVATFSNGAIVSTGTSGRFGISEGTGTINILSGSQITSRLVDIGRQGSPDFPPVNAVNTALNIGGPNSRITSAQLVLPRNLGTATMTVTGGGKWIGQAFDTIFGNTFTASLRGARATVTVNGPGSEWNLPATFITSGGAANATGDQYSGGTTDFTVSGGGVVKAQSFNFGQNNAGVTNFIADGTNTLVSTVGQGAGTGGWAMSGNLGKVSDPAPGAASLVNVTIRNGAQATVAGGISSGNRFNATDDANSGGGEVVLNVSSGASATVNSTTFFSLSEGSKATINVNGGSLTVLDTVVTNGGYSNLAGDLLLGGDSTFSVSGGGALRTESLNFSQNSGRTVFVADGPTTVVTSVGIGTGTGSWVTSNNLAIPGTPAVTDFTVRNGATASLPGSLWGSGGITGSDNGVSTFAVQSGGRLNVGGFVILSDPAAAQSHMTITGINSQLSVGTSLLVGGNGTVTGGTASITVTDGAVATVNALTIVYANSSATIGTGTLKGSLTTQQDVGVDGVINFNAGTFNTVGTLEVAGSVLLSTAARNPVTGTPTNKKFVEAGQATLTTSGVIDLNDNDMLIHDTTAGAKQKYENFIKLARNGGAWDQPGITSTAAKNQSAPKIRALGIISGAEYASAGGTTFNGKPVVATDTLIKFTFNGDTDLNGRVNFDDYAKTDGGFNNNRTGWFNGDFDFNGVVNFDDYSLIDQAFNNQNSVVLSVGGDLAGPPADREIVKLDHSGAHRMLVPAQAMDSADAMEHFTAVDSDNIGGNGLQAVPEPGALGLAGVALVGALHRRRRRQA